MLRSSPYDREIARLALPALGALAAEPLYLLVDTAIVGHLGTSQLAALAVAGSALSLAVSLCNFLAYGTTARVARLHGAGHEEEAGEIASQSLWLSLAIGLTLAVVALAAASPIVSLFGGAHHVRSLASMYLRISAGGLPFALVALAGQGYLRGVADLRTPLLVVAAAHTSNAVLEVVFVYGFHWGLAGSAWGTVIAQAGMGVAFALLLLRAPALSRRPDRQRIVSLLRIGGDIFIRTAALLGSFAVASAVLARIESASLGAHQIAFQLYTFLALVVDAVAVAGQVLVGRMLGGGDRDGAFAAARRMIEWALAAGIVLGAALLALTGPIPRAFTSDPAVVHRAHEIWPLFALMQPAGAIVFALDGILIGAGDTRYIKWSMVAAAAVFVPLALAALHFDWGIVGVWWALLAMMGVRLLTCGARFVGRRWAITGSGRVAVAE